MALKLVWNKRPSSYLKKELKRISRESFQGAESVETGILSNLDKALDEPERYPSDKYKKNNDGTYRAFETYSYRVAYRFSKSEIKILRIRHIKQEPKNY
ncbi:MAG: type II toxin-antitoxin system RelE/ParE family toxin [Bacteroidota bacterium]